MAVAAFPPADPICPFVEPAVIIRRAGAVCLSGLPPAELRWLWPGRIPLGRVTLLVSDPGLGKSLVALDIAARVSRGAPWPDAKAEAETGSAESVSRLPLENSSFDSSLPAAAGHSSFSTPGSVLLLNPEDRLAETVRPRLESLGADCSQVVVLPSLLDIVTPYPKGTLMDGHGDFFRATRLLASLPNARLLIVDPINAYLSGVDAQRILLALAEIAARRRVAVVIVSHVSKKGGAAIHRALGSLALVSVARAVWVITKDPADGRRRLLLPIKNNLASNAGGLAFSITSTSSGGAPVVHWSAEPVELSADSVVGPARACGRPDGEVQQAIDWLRTRLTNEPSPCKPIKEEAAAYGFSPSTLGRALRAMGGHAVRIGGADGHWAWSLRDQECRTQGGTD